MNKSDITITVVLAIILFGGIFAIVLSGYNDFVKIEPLIQYCKDNGYDGIRYEEASFLRDEPRCANFTIEERFDKEYDALVSEEVQ